MLQLRDARIESARFHRRTQPVDTLVLHYTALDLAASLKVLRTGAVSVHYVLAEDGTAHKILEDNEAGYHAGLSTWRGQPRVNERSIGIEIVNLDGNVHAYPAVQIKALVELIKKILAAHPLIKPGNIVGHSDIAPKRKVDPGKLFPWKKLADAGIGLWPVGAAAAVSPAGATTAPATTAPATTAPATTAPATTAPTTSEAAAQTLLSQCGYPAPHAYGESGGKFVYVMDADHPQAGVTNIVRVTTADILKAFQLRYTPNQADGKLTAQTMSLLKKLAAMS